VTVPEPEPAARDAARIGELDGLRALVLLVPIFHFSIEAARSWSPAAALPVYLVGVAGVVGLDVFFVLSGFLITGILLDAKGATGYFRSFYVRRAFRILPLYYGFLLLYLVVLPLLVPWDAGMRLDVVDQLPYWTYVVNVPYAFHGPLAAYTGHIWSLAVEEQFYLVWPLAVCWLRTAALRRLVLACLVLTVAVRYGLAAALPDTQAFYALTPARLDGLMLGALLAIARRDAAGWSHVSRSLRRAGPFALLALVASIVALSRQSAGFDAPSAFLATLTLTGSAYFAAAVVAAVLERRGGMWRHLLTSRPARQVGTYSYGIYLLHNPLGHVLGQAGVWSRPIAGAGIGETALYTASMTLLSIVVAATSWHLMEKPLLRLRPRQARPDVPRAR